LLGRGTGAGELAEVLRHGAVAAIPTESSYGLACCPLSQRGVDRIVRLKGRDASKALLVLFAGRDQLEPLGIAASPALLDRFFAIWPAPLTVVFPLREPIAASLGASTLAVRVPAEERLRSLLARVGPVTGTSLNRSGDPPCADPEDAARLFSGDIDVLVDGGATPGGLPSTVVDATAQPPRLLRAGAYAWPPAGS